MATAVDVVRLDAGRYAPARAALGRAFFDYNVMVCAAPDPRRRLSAVPTLYGAILADCLRYGEVYGTPEMAGAACWLAPTRDTITIMRQIRAGMLLLPLRFGLRGFNRLLAFDAIARKLHHLHAPEPHWYLAALGVSPEHQGQGIGSALMQPILARADSLQLPCYLETHQSQNVRLYERHGFAVSCHTEVPGQSIPVWAMLRQPRRAGA